MMRKSEMVRKINELKSDRDDLRDENRRLQAQVRDSHYQALDAEENADIARRLMLSAAKGFGLIGHFSQAQFESYHYEGTQVTFTLINVKGEYSVGIKPGDRIGLFLVDEKL